MIINSPSRDRPVNYGPFPLETLPRDASIVSLEAAAPAIKPAATADGTGPLTAALDKYRTIYTQLAGGEAGPARAPVPDDLARRAADVKGFCYFMDASQVGICKLPANAWLHGSAKENLDHAVVLIVEHGTAPGNDNIANDWIAGAITSAATMRAAEIAVVVAGHIRQMGWNAHCHVAGADCLDAERLAVLSGLALRDGDAIINPYLGKAFSIAVIATDYALAIDEPLAPSARNAKGLHYWWGQNGAQSGRERNRRNRRPAHMSRYPMETVKRIDRPTTLILDDEVPRVPKRAAFFERALQGDLGAKSQKERTRFSFKHPTSWSLLHAIRALVPYQNGELTDSPNLNLSDRVANAKAVKALSYFLGADLTGICEIPRYAWHSHKENGKPIDMYHRYAIVMLIDQGYDTMEGASGDDWISGTQSMRGYLRGAEIAGVMGELLRSQGVSARSQTNADSDVLHIPLVLWAGLGELSRIGELVLNPFVGPRFKSVVLTTDLPLEVDKPIDFGLQTFCQSCYKCAHECPCDAIPWGDKVMFNGYEIWKPDVERCTRYRLTNMKGAACGRCMKTCPINKVVDYDGPWLTRAASWLGVNAMWMKPVMAPMAAWLDDKLGNGIRNPVKRWWFDHEIVDGKTIAAKGTNERDIEPAKVMKPEDQKMAYFHANMMPPPDAADPVPLDRKAGLAAKGLLETPVQARARKARGEGPPAHYIPTPELGIGDTSATRKLNVFDQKMAAK